MIEQGNMVVNEDHHWGEQKTLDVLEKEIGNWERNPMVKHQHSIYVRTCVQFSTLRGRKTRKYKPCITKKLISDCKQEKVIHLRNYAQCSKILAVGYVPD